MFKSIKELLWVLLEEALFVVGLADITTRRASDEYEARHYPEHTR